MLVVQPNCGQSYTSIIMAQETALNIRTDIIMVHRENPWGVDPGSGLAVYPIHIDPPLSASNLLLSAQYGSTSIHIFSRAFFWIVERPNLFKILLDHST